MHISHIFHMVTVQRIIFSTTSEYTKITRSRYTSIIRTLRSVMRNTGKSRQSIVVDTAGRCGRNEYRRRSELACKERTLENIIFDVDQLSRLSRTEQAQRLEEAERQIDDIQRAAANDPASLSWIDQQRQYLVDMQHQIFEC